MVNGVRHKGTVELFGSVGQSSRHEARKDVADCRYGCLVFYIFVIYPVSLMVLFFHYWMALRNSSALATGK